MKLSALDTTWTWHYLRLTRRRHQFCKTPVSSGDSLTRRPHVSPIWKTEHPAILSSGTSEFGVTICESGRESSEWLDHARHPVHTTPALYSSNGNGHSKRINRRSRSLFRKNLNKKRQTRCIERRDCVEPYPRIFRESPSDTCLQAVLDFTKVSENSGNDVRDPTLLVVCLISKVSLICSRLD